MIKKHLQPNALTGNSVSKYDYDELKKKLNEARWCIHELETNSNILQNKIQLLQHEINSRNIQIEKLESTTIKLYNQDGIK